VDKPAKFEDYYINWAILSPGSFGFDTDGPYGYVRPEDLAYIGHLFETHVHKCSGVISGGYGCGSLVPTEGGLCRTCETHRGFQERNPQQQCGTCGHKTSTEGEHWIGWKDDRSFPFCSEGCHERRTELGYV